MSERRTCGQCGESYAMSACGPTHALVAAERCHLYPALLAERDELREALRAIVDSEPGEKRADAMATGRTLLSRHPAQPVKGTP